MEFVIPQKNIAELVGIASKIAKRTTIPIVECVRIRFGKKGFAVESTNMDIWLSLATSDFSPKVEATAIMPCQQLNSIISSIPKEQDITFSVTDKRMVMKTGSAKYQFGLLPDSEWPTLPWNEKAEKVRINSSVLCGATEYVAGSISIDESRYYLNGVNIKSVKGKKALCFMATDGHIASSIGVETAQVSNIKENGVIIPRDLISVYMDLLTRIGDDVDVSLEITESKCRMEYEAGYRVSVTGRMIDGEFPAMERIIPYERENIVNILPKDEVLSALTRLNILSRREKGSPVNIEFKGDTMKMSVTSEHGEAEERIKVVHVKGDDMEICIAIPKLQTLLSAFEEADIFFGSTGGVEPVVLSAGEETIKPNEGNFSIVMPMRG